jgi:phospholipase D1/2
LKIKENILLLKVKEWLQNLGIGEHIPVVRDEDEADDMNNVPSPSETFD